MDLNPHDIDNQAIFNYLEMLPSTFKITESTFIAADFDSNGDVIIQLEQSLIYTGCSLSKFNACFNTM
ncbi:hypothetical protein KEN51_CDS0409 [Pseudomonas phage vB_Pae10145-KEN51]|uniref:Uncharacterized protein n=3 Tax=Viruses TaxID=10239 RepID=A0AAE7S6Z7_9CAUD|nr:hypothetical protein fnug_40 [Pseudomonas phage fnug]QXN68673.1 hypothetical protein [Pseudomonas phage PA7]USL86626.1 hypothetical protein CDGHABPJ_00168 [Pseudomonas phage OMKO1]UXD83381.1 hypothetical protein NP274_00335 [Pseudomonas phage Koomba boorn-mokiny kep-wari Wadjak 1]WAX23575.1 hypothetical protein [Pseudomonas phage pPA-N1803-4At.2]WNV47711.1 hypothetical protein [Pseudomonas phage fMGyn-Pae01]WNV50008.1 hypothetical protein [Pseudomonas phage ANB1]WNV50425.1 hypothetical pr